MQQCAINKRKQHATITHKVTNKNMKLCMSDRRSVRSTCMTASTRTRRRPGASWSSSTRSSLGRRRAGRRDSCRSLRKNTPPEKKTLWKISMRSTKSGGGWEFLLLDCRAKACSKGVFFHRHRYAYLERRGLHW